MKVVFDANFWCRHWYFPERVQTWRCAELLKAKTNS